MLRDQRGVLEFASVCAVITVDHIDALDTDTVAVQMAQRLIDALLVRPIRVTPRAAPRLQITQAGLDAIGSNLPVPSPNPPHVRHELTVSWMWIGAHLGKFGSVSECLTRRQLIARGERADFDLLLSSPSGRAAVRVLLSTPSRSEVERLLRRAARDPAMERVRFMVRDARLKAWVLSIAEDLDLLEMTSASPLT